DVDDAAAIASRSAAGCGGGSGSVGDDGRTYFVNRSITRPSRRALRATTSVSGAVAAGFGFDVEISTVGESSAALAESRMAIRFVRSMSRSPAGQISIAIGTTPFRYISTAPRSTSFSVAKR